MARSYMAGPATGGYLVWNFGSYTIPINQTDVIKISFVAPCDLRLQRIQWCATNNSGGTATFQMYTNSTLSTTGATSLFNATVDLDANEIGYVEPLAGGAETFASSAARDVTRGQFVFTEWTTDATATLTDLSLQVVATMAGHVRSNVYDEALGV